MNNISKRANTNMIVKTVLFLTIYIVPFVLLNLGLITAPWLAIMLYVVSAIGMGGIGMGIMHDANHGCYSKKTNVNERLGWTLDLVGCSSSLWKLQHNVLHHTFTNIHGHDEDISAPIMLFRFSPHGKSYKIQKFQHYYVWFFYSILTLYWITAKDFLKTFDYYKMGLIKTKKELRMQILKLIPMKLAYFTYALVLPMVFAPFSAWWILLGFVIMHLIAGLALSVVFQLAHVVPNMNFPQPNESEEMDNNWYVHQLQTTSNFAPKNKLMFWYFGGLTNQVEHHLFPNICHVHYKRISRIVAKTAKEFELPYHVNKTFFAAVKGHAQVLKNLGRSQTV